MPVALEIPSLADLAPARCASRRWCSPRSWSPPLRRSAGPAGRSSTRSSASLSADPPGRSPPPASRSSPSRATSRCSASRDRASAWRDSYRTTLAGAAATRLLPTAGAGGAALTLWVLKRTRPRRRAHAAHLPRAPLRGLPRRAARRRRLAAGRCLVPAALAGAALLAAPVRPASCSRRASATPRALAAPPAPAPARRARLVGLRLRRAVGRLPRRRRAAGRSASLVARLLPRPGRQHRPAARRRLQRHDRRLHRLRRRARARRSPPSLAYRAIAIWLPAPLGAHALAGLSAHGGRRPARAAAAAAAEACHAAR